MTNYRKRLNNATLYFGNNLTKTIKTRCGYGLGDLLTQKANFERVGGMIGTIATLPLTLPLLAISWIAEPRKEINTASVFGDYYQSKYPVRDVVVGISMAGSIVGESIDRLLYTHPEWTGGQRRRHIFREIGSGAASKAVVATLGLSLLVYGVCKSDQIQAKNDAANVAYYEKYDKYNSLAEKIANTNLDRKLSSNEKLRLYQEMHIPIHFPEETRSPSLEELQQYVKMKSGKNER